MRIYPIIKLLASLYLGMALIGASSAQEDSNQIVIGEELKIFSDTLGEERSILVGKPASYEQGNESYPIMIVLDGGAHFHYTTGLTKYLASNQFIPELLVIAVQNTDRNRDLTPPSQVPREIEGLPTHGGATNFQTFLADELLPWIDENYRTRPYKILAGHSFGGLFAINSLVTRPELFDAYIAISPSLQWNDQRLVDRAEAFFDNTAKLDASLFMTVGNEGNGLLGGVRKLSGVLDEKAPSGFDWHFEHMPLETHGSVPQRSTYQGLEFVFANWYLRNPDEFYSKYGMDAIEQFYETGDNKYGYERGVPSSTLLNIIARLANSGQIGEANDLLLRRKDTLQAPAGFYEFIASTNREAGNKQQAIELYRLALATNPGSQASKQALTDLGEDFSDLIPDVSVEAAILAKYVGSYDVQQADTIDITLEGDSLFREYSGSRYELLPRSETEFYIAEDDIQYAFNFDSDGGVVGFAIRINGGTLQARKIGAIN